MPFSPIAAKKSARHRYGHFASALIDATQGAQLRVPMFIRVCIVLDIPSPFVNIRRATDIRPIDLRLREEKLLIVIGRKPEGTISFGRKRRSCGKQKEQKKVPHKPPRMKLPGRRISSRNHGR